MQLTNKNNNIIILITDNKHSFEIFKIDINYHYFEIITDDNYITVNIHNYDDNIDDIEFEIDLSAGIKDKSLLIIEGKEYYFSDIKELKKAVINYFKKCNG